MDYAEIILEVARITREAREAVLAKIAASQLGEAFMELDNEEPSFYYADC